MPVEHSPPEALPLDGVRVVSLGWIWVGAVIGQLLGDMGAEVIRIESWARQDISRNLPPFIEGREGLSYNSVNGGRSQRSALLDLRQPRALELLRDLLTVSDAVVDNYRAGTMQRWGLGHEDVRALNPGIIALSCSAAGQTGPLDRIATYGSNVSAMGGLDSVQGFADGPIPAGISIVDPLYGSAAAVAIIAALERRTKTGRGESIDFSQWEFTVGMMSGPWTDYKMNGRILGPMGNRDPMMAPHGVYPCGGEDAWVCIAVKTDAQWAALCGLMEQPELAGDPRFADPFRRQRNHDILDRLLSDWTRGRDKWGTALALQDQGVPAFPHLSDREVFEDRHFWERGVWRETEHPLTGRHTGPSPVWRLSDGPQDGSRPCPVLGQDSEYVFGEVLGLPHREVEELQTAGVVA